MAKLTKQEFIDKVLTFKDGGKNAYGYQQHVGTTLDKGIFLNVASKGSKVLNLYTKGIKPVYCTIFNLANEEFHRFDENTAERYL